MTVFNNSIYFQFNTVHKHKNQCAIQIILDVAALLNPERLFKLVVAVSRRQFRLLFVLDALSLIYFLKGVSFSLCKLVL